MRKANKNYLLTVGIVWLASTVALGLFYSMCITSQESDMALVRSDISRAQETYGALMKAQSPAGQTRLMEEQQEKRDLAIDFVAEFSKTESLAFMVNKLAQKQKLGAFGSSRIATQKNDVMDDCKYITKQKVRIVFDADFNAFATFVNTMERSKPIVFVDVFTVTNAQDGKSTSNNSIDLAVFCSKNEL
jgi:hypothetical protein